MRLAITLVAAFAAIVTAAALAGTQAGGTRTFGAKLVSKGEVPPAVGAASATGSFSAAGSYTCGAKEKNCLQKPGKLTWTLKFKNLTGPALLAHIHLGKPGVSGPVAISLCAPCKSGQTGTISVSKAVFAAIFANGAYVNIHTKKNPGGEVRGQLKPLTATL